MSVVLSVNDGKAPSEFFDSQGFIGYHIYSGGDYHIEGNSICEIDTGFALLFPDNCCGFLTESGWGNYGLHIVARKIKSGRVKILLANIDKFSIMIEKKIIFVICISAKNDF